MPSEADSLLNSSPPKGAATFSAAPSAARRPGWVSQMIAILIKNFGVKFSRPQLANTMIEIGLPLFYVALLFVMRPMLQDIDTPASKYLPSQPIAPAASCSGDTRISFAPDGAAERKLLEGALLDANVSCPLVGYPDYPSMRSAMLANDQYLRAMTLAACVLNLTSNTYTLLPQTLDFADPPFDPTDDGLAYYKRDALDDVTRVASVWVLSGVPSLLSALDRAFAERHTHGAAAMMSRTLGNISVAKLPLPAFKSSYLPGSDFLLYLVPFYVTYGITSIVQLSFKSLVVEREKHLVEGMHMMGLSSRANIGGWYLTFAILHCNGPLITTLLVFATGFIKTSNLIFLFITLLLHLLGTITFTFLLLPFAPKSSVAELFGMLASVVPSVGLYVLNTATNYPPILFWLSCLVAPAAAPLGVSRFVVAEKGGGALTSATSGDYPLLAIWALQLFDACLYAFLAWYFDNVIAAPGASGDRKPWDFCLPWRVRAPPHGEAPPISLPAGVAVKAEKLSKSFPATPEPVLAVNELSFEMLDGQVTGLLGQNGAGKSSAIHMLCGLLQPTSGTASVRGHDVRYEMDAIRALSGVCPQHDLLFDELSLRQHVDLFARLKGVPLRDARAQLDEWLGRLEMRAKLDVPTELLSGGQRRKASLIIALLGSPKFVLLDEPTAGMDPRSRRSVWDFVEASRAGRATLLTTHFMDEADVLCSRVVIVSKGTCAATGSPADLKAQYASGYHLSLALRPSARDGEALLAFTQKHVRGATLEDASAEQAAITLPAEEADGFASLFASLDEAKASLGVESYGVSVPSLQEAFVKVLDAQQGAGGYAPSEPIPTARFAYTKLSFVDQLRVALLKARYQFEADLTSSLQMLVGVCVLVILAFSIGQWTAKRRAPIDPTVPYAVTLSPDVFHAEHWPLPYAPPASLAAPLAPASPLQLRYGFTAQPVFVDGLNHSDPNATHRALAASLSFDGGVYGAFAMPDPQSAVGVHTTILQNSSYPHSLPVFVSLLDQALIQTAAPGLELTARVGKLPSVADSMAGAEAGAKTTLLVAPIIMVFAMLTSVLATATRLAGERFHHTKQLLLLSGMDVRVFWLGCLLWDLMLLGSSVVMVGILAGAASGALKAEAMLPLLVAELCALPGILLFSYVITAPFSNKEQVSAFLLALFMGTGLIPTIVLGVMKNATVKLAIQLVLLLTPPSQVVTAITAVLNTQHVSLQQEAAGGAAKGVGAYFSLFVEMQHWDEQTGILQTTTAVGCGLVALVAAVMSAGFALLFYATEIRGFSAPRTPHSHHAKELAAAREETREEGEEDADVVAERARVLAMAPESNEAAVRVTHLSKLFNVSVAAKCAELTPLLSVDDVSFAIAPNTCFALLGPNGAGKTTTINMLSGEHTPTTGSAQLANLPATASLTEVFQHTGFCPQLRGLWESLTLRQHLTIILRLKGLVGSELEMAIAAVEKGYGLEAHAHKRSSQLSGGTQRKLSAALALSCGKPKVVFVDEPTTGVDVGTRRFIWDRIKEATKQCVVMLTTHYMDEADALADRIGIMAKGRLRVIGSPQHLKTRHGGGYTVHLKAAAETEEQLALVDAQLVQLVHQLFSGVKQAPGRDLGVLEFEVAQGFEFAKVFAALEEAKRTLGLQYFSMTQTSLETVFLRVAEKYNNDALPKPVPDAPSKPAK
ncbi:hypothetical protein AB1Y20_000011 [Prymnesium parvum]|uniref:ABC transporter domain-containing protein n=1 Tax=Prymnesium parvum TaxID=97485 RepID=A0AB34K776_PRYPA